MKIYLGGASAERELVIADAEKLEAAGHTIRVDWGDSFWRHVHPEALSGCWLWHGAVDEWGYGRVCRYVAGRRISKATRYAWATAYGAPPKELCVCHKCDVPGCVNPEHLFLGTHKDNMQDMAKKGRAVRMSGELAPAAKLTWEIVAQIRELRREGRSGLSLAREFGIGKSQIQNILSGHNWRLS